jgi:hypothetical protein
VSARPPADSTIADFIERALASGIPHNSLVGLLTARGWPEKEVYEALADHYQRVAGLDIPRRTGAGASAREAFFYLLIFSTLATWTIGFGYLAFSLIDWWFADALFMRYQQTFETYTVTWSLASLIIAFPLYLLISRIVVRETAAQPGKLDSPIRKWLTYMALVIAAGVFMGDLITVLASLLRGETTARFLAKAFVVLLLSGGVFFYYFGGLRKTDAAAAGVSRDRLMALLSSLAVLVLVILGFTHLGPPRAQRDFRADNQRVQNLYNLSTEIRHYWISHASQLPTGMDQLYGAVLSDPITHAPYEYHPKQGSRYELCATFSRRGEGPETTTVPNQWAHPAGHYCFSLDASDLQLLPPPYFPE